jgi:hypothetical protein
MKFESYEFKVKFLKIKKTFHTPMGGSWVRPEDIFKQWYSARTGEVVRAWYISPQGKGNVIVRYHDGYAVLNWMDLEDSNFFEYLLSACKRRYRRFKNRNVLMPTSEV